MKQSHFEFAMGAFAGIIVLAGVVLSNGCTSMGNKPIDTAQASVIACTTATQAVAYATENAARLNPADKVIVDTAIKTVKPICDSSKPPTLTQAEFDALSGATNALMQVQVNKSVAAPIIGTGVVTGDDLGVPAK